MGSANRMSQRMERALGAAAISMSRGKRFRSGLEKLRKTGKEVVGI